MTSDQRTQIEGLRVNVAKTTMPLRAKMRWLKADLAVLATADEPDTAVIQQKIDELLALKKQAMNQRYTHISEVRKLLTAEQRVAYDMMILKRVKGRRHKEREY